MIFIILVYHIIGYLNLEVEGVFIERFINICKVKKILLWNIKVKDGTKIHLNISIKDFKNIRAIVKRTNTRIKIRKKRGVPFIINKYKKRKLLCVTTIIVFTAIIILSNFIWNIEIQGNNSIDTNLIVEQLSKEGLRIGVLKNKVDTNMIINDLRLKNDNIAWIGIRLTGTNAIIKIKERKKAPEIINEDEYCNIISNKNALIEEINVQNGTAIVKPGDIVKEGDRLVNGYLEGKHTGLRYVHATANIKARVWYSKKEKKYFHSSILTDTGRKENKYTLKISNFKINFYKTLSKFEKYDTMRTFFYLPIEIIKTTNIEKRMEETTYKKEELERSFN